METQTEMEVSEKKETVQTDATTRTAVAEAVIEYAPSAVDATTPLTSTKAQSDVSMFVVDQLVTVLLLLGQQHFRIVPEWR